ncbi:MAG: T9SS type A sorting domain-containing protein [Bacteroidales bacterium]|nr:T9SS type A sorting domain-containing protein [Bacteroidales bacterium]
MKRKTLLLMLLMALISSGAWAQFSGSGSASDPYLISSSSEWNSLASNVNSGTSYSGKYFKMTSDITISGSTQNYMVGTMSGETSSGNAFSGNFNGDGHTITISYSTSSGFYYTAPFRYISGATIKNVKVAGTMSVYKYMGSLVGYCMGTNNIENCVSEVAMTATISGDATMGGFISHVHGGTTNIRGCVFKGKLLKPTSGSNTPSNVGGFIGWTDHGSAYSYFYDCVFAPSQVTVSTSNSATFSRGNSSNSSGIYIYNSFYTQTHGTTQGSKLQYTITAGSNVTVALGYNSNDPVEYNLSGITGYKNTSAKGIKYDNKIYAASGNSVKLNLTSTFEYPQYSTTAGTLSGNGNPYSLSMPSNNCVISATNGAVYISNEADWNTFCSNVTNGTNNYAGKTVLMTADIGSANDPVTTICGAYTDDNNYKAFKGTFDGGGHTLYVNLTNMPKFSAPFKIVENATIKNLRTAGSITGKTGDSSTLGQGRVISGLVAISKGTTNIIGCSSSMDITSLYGTGSDVTLAGLVASTMGGNLTVEGCAFEGSMTAKKTDANHNCGIVAYPYSTVTVTVRNTVFAPRNLDTKDDTDHSWTFARKKDNTTTVNISNCYYTEPLTSVTANIQGTKVYSVTGETGVTVEMNGTANPTYNGSGLSFYSPGFTFTNKDNNTIVYGAQNNSLSLNLSTSTSGHQRFLASAGTLSTAGDHYTLTMPASNVTISSDYKTFITNGNWNTANCWSPAAVPIGEDVKIAANVTIPNGVVATANNIIVNSGKTITIADGGQLRHNSGNVDVIMNKGITAYSGDKDNYYFFASPATNSDLTASSYGLTTGTYDLYTFDYDNVDNTTGQLLEWKHEIGSTAITRGKGYLYANSSNRTITTPSITVAPSNASYDVTLSYDATGTWRFNGWNLVGNPFACNASVSGCDFYVINGDEVEAATTDVIAPMQGIFAQATAPGQSVTFSRVSENSSNNTTSSVNLILKPADTRDAKVIDVARVRFNEGEGLEKFQLNPDHTKLYIPQGDKDFAVVHTQAEGELPVNFKAEENGRYMLSFVMEEANFNYLHLIDNMTGADVDLLAGASTGSATYTFNAKTTDYESRFKLVFAASDVDGSSTSSETFAFYSNGAWVINNEGDATLQVVDVLGHVLSSDRISGATTKAINAAPGVYMLRLINGDNVKVQKIVVR